MTQRRFTRGSPVACAVLCAWFAWAHRAKASPLFDLTGDTAGMGGLQARAVPAGSAAAYFNPALLTASPASLQLGFLLLRQQIAITLDGRPGTEFAVPDDVANAGRADFSRFDNYPIPTNDLQFGRTADDLDPGFAARPRQGAGSGEETFTYESFGLDVKLFEERLALGMHALIPNGQFTELRAFYNDEREQYFTNSLHPELYADRLTAPSLALGAGVRITDELSLGAGATLSLQAEVVAQTYVVDTGDLSKILIDMDGGVEVALAPHFGLSYVAGERLRLTATLHAPRKLELETRFTFLLASGVEQASGVPFVLSYMPWQIGAGFAYDLLHAPEQTLTLACSAVYATWHDYEDRHGDRPHEAYPWADTLSPTLGARYRIGALSTFVDTAYAPSPVPDQEGRSNYVDNDRLSAGLGGELAFTLFGTDMSAGLTLQAHHLLARHHEKTPTPTRDDGENAAPGLVKDEVPDDAQLSGEPLEGAEGLQTNNPGWPGFGSEGFVFAASVHWRVLL